MNKQETRNALRMLRAALEEATDTENFDYQRGRQPSKKHADFVMRLKAGIEELEKELKGSKRNPRYLVSRDGNEVGIFPGFNALMAINAARKIYGPGKYSSVKTGEAMFIGRGALQAEERLREETAVRAAQKAAAKRDKIKAPGKRMKRNPTDRPALDNQLVLIGRKAYQGVRVFDIYKQPEGLFEHGLARIGNEIRWLERKNKNTWIGRPGPAGVRNVPWINQQLLIEEGHGDLIQRNPLEKSAEHPIEVTRHYRSGGPNYLSPWQRAMAIGQEELFDTGIQMLPRVAERRAALFATRNPGATKRAKEWYESQERAKELKSYSSKSNPSVKAIYQKFNGRPSRRSRNVAAPAGTPRDLAQLGRLRTIKTVDGRTWRFPGDRAPFLAADSRGKLHIVGGQYRANPAGEDCGEIDLVEYQTSKPHLGHDNETIYYHHMGEETGERPTLEITPAGELVIHGGAYRIEPEGLVN